MLDRGVAEATGAGVAAGTGVTIGSGAAVAAFLCDRLLLAGDAAGEAAALGGAGDASVALAVSFRLKVGRFVGDGETAAEVLLAAAGEEAALGAGEALVLWVRCFAGEGEPAGVGV